MMNKVVKENKDAVPVVIRGDGMAKHSMIRAVMDICAKNGIWKLEIAAQKESKEQAEAAKESGPGKK